MFVKIYRNYLSFLKALDHRYKLCDYDLIGFQMIQTTYAVLKLYFVFYELINTKKAYDIVYE